MCKDSSKRRGSLFLRALQTHAMEWALPDLYGLKCLQQSVGNALSRESKTKDLTHCNGAPLSHVFIEIRDGVSDSTC